MHDSAEFAGAGRDNQQLDNASSLRFFLGFRETAGYMARIEEGLHELGLTATAVDLSGHPFGYGQPGWWSNVAQRLAQGRRGGRGLRRLWWRAMQWALTASVMVWAVPRFNVFVLTSLPAPAAIATIGLLRLTRKRVIVVFTGSDSRPPYLDGFTQRSLASMSQVERGVRDKRRAVRAMERWAHVVVSHTASSHFLRRPFVPFLTVGFPGIESSPDESRAPSNGRLRVLHAPSDPISKGTPEIRRVIDELSVGMEIDYIELTGTPHGQVVAELKRADLVIDQLYSDQPMPGLSTEAASLGKPVIIGGYDWDSLQAEGAAPRWPPTVQVAPEELGATVRDLLANAERRASVGSSLSRFVDDHWRRRHVAERYVRLALADVPAQWLFSPDQILCVHGYGATRETSKRAIGSLISHAGVQALGLSDKPALERRVVARATESGA